MAKDKKVKSKESSSLSREEALARAIKDIEKEYGKGAIMDLDGDTSIKVETISSGSLSIDKALGVGGYPRGRIIEVYGPESSGKTTVALHAIAEVQKQGGVAAFIDAENALDPEYAKALGVDFTAGRFFLSQPDTGEQGLDIAERLASSGAIDIIVVDSVAALVPRTEIEGTIGDVTIGLQARLMSQALRKLTGIINRSNVIAIFINQLREKVGVMYGNPEVTTGGRALKFYSTIRMEVRKGDQIKEGSEVIGNRTKIKIVKNKVAPPFKTTEVDIMYGEGISPLGETLDIAAEYDIIKKAGAWYSYQGEKLGQGREAVKKILAENPDLYKEIYDKVRSVFLSTVNKSSSEANQDDLVTEDNE